MAIKRDRRRARRRLDQCSKKELDKQDVVSVIGVVRANSMVNREQMAQRRL
jgi:hypothetical protein